MASSRFVDSICQSVHTKLFSKCREDLIHVIERELKIFDDNGMCLPSPTIYETGTNPTYLSTLQPSTDAWNSWQKTLNANVVVSTFFERRKRLIRLRGGWLLRRRTTMRWRTRSRSLFLLLRLSPGMTGRIFRGSLLLLARLVWFRLDVRMVLEGCSWKIV